MKVGCFPELYLMGIDPGVLRFMTPYLDNFIYLLEELMITKRIKLAVSAFLLTAVVGTGLSVVMLPGKASANIPICRCRMSGEYYYEKLATGGCAWLCD